MSESFFGDIKKMPDKLLGERLAESQKAVADYSRECERRSNFTSAERLADRLHHLLHDARGIDCDYHYSDWGTGQLTTCRGEFKGMAERLERWAEKYVQNSKPINEKSLDELMTVLEKR